MRQENLNEVFAKTRKCVDPSVSYIKLLPTQRDSDGKEKTKDSHVHTTNSRGKLTIFLL